MSSDIDRIINVRVVAEGLPLTPPRNPWRRRAASGLLVPTEYGDDASAAFGSAIDPASFAWTSWLRGSFAGAPWVGAASAGISGDGDHNFDEPTNPPNVGLAQGGFDSAHFNGTTSVLSNENLISNFLGTSGSAFCLFWANSENASSASEWVNGCFFTDVGQGRFAFGLSTNGAHIGLYDGSWHSIDVACGTFGWHLAQVKYDGTNLHLRVDSGVWSTVSAGSPSFAVASVQIGQDYSGANILNGYILEQATIKQALTDGEFDGIKAYLNTRYSLSL